MYCRARQRITIELGFELTVTTTNYQLPTTNYQLPTTNYQFPIAY
ncbi:MAG: hypothetical protein AAF630_13125 [Cyanobacteria bacterium P01_C01_bin.38]